VRAIWVACRFCGQDWLAGHWTAIRGGKRMHLGDTPERECKDLVKDSGRNVRVLRALS
jgi:hypothetical protein